MVGLVEVLWKTFASLLNQRFTAAITFHDVLYEFWVGRDMETTALKFNLIQQLTDMRGQSSTRYLWTSRRHIMPWTGIDTSILLWHTGSDPGRFGASIRTGDGLPWWAGKEVTMVLHSRDTTELPRETPCLPRYSMWLCKPSDTNG